MLYLKFTRPSFYIQANDVFWQFFLSIPCPSVRCPPTFQAINICANVFSSPGILSSGFGVFLLFYCRHHPAHLTG